MPSALDCALAIVQRVIFESSIHLGLISDHQSICFSGCGISVYLGQDISRTDMSTVEV